MRQIRYDHSVVEREAPRSLERHRQSWQRSGTWEPDLWGFLTIVPILQLQATIEDRDRRIAELEAEVERLRVAAGETEPTDAA
ncbi:MAG: hypothetical protein IIC36_15255 [Gemmatimonadetes bacterium]|nr:hypothetical protein [Gemmatimonadota bacterium]